MEVNSEKKFPNDLILCMNYHYVQEKECTKKLPTLTSLYVALIELLFPTSAISNDVNSSMSGCSESMAQPG